MQFELVPEYNILLFNNTAPKNGCLTLLDTGASLPVWTGKTEALKGLYPDAYESRDFVYIGKAVPLWVIPTYELSDSVDTVIFHDMCVAVYELPVDANMILSANIIGNGTMMLGNRTLRLDIPFTQLLVSPKHNMRGFVDGLTIKAYTQSRTLEEVRHDTALYNLADEYDVTTMDIYSLLDEIIYGETTLTNEEIMEQIAQLVRRGS